jgi:hypothetical protein
MEGKMEQITINWHGPYTLDNYDRHEIASQKGIYAIYRRWGDSEKLIYLGKTERSFRDRINEHYGDWLWDKRGELKVRLGVMACEQGRKYSSQKLTDIEALLIHWHQPEFNTSNIQYYRGRERLEVINKGRRGQLKNKVSTLELIDMR